MAGRRCRVRLALGQFFRSARGAKCAFEAMMTMTKIDVAAIEAACRG
nr:hypothetical protein [Marinobacter sp. UBA4489]